MKLLFDCTELSYFNEKSGHRAGVFFVALNLFKELKKRNVDITFHCDFKRYYIMKTISEFSDIPLLEEHSILNKFVGWLVYKTDNLPKKIKYAVLIFARFYDKYLCKINKPNLKDIEKFDAYFSPFTPPSVEIEHSAIKKFRMLHDIIPILENGYPKSPKDWYYKIYTTISDKNNNHYLANSESTRSDVLKYFKIKEDKIKTILLGADDKFHPEERTTNEKYILSLCTLGKRKNLIFAIKNFFEFINTYNINDLKMVLVGGIWQKFTKELQSAIGDFDKTKLDFLGYVEDEKLPELYSNAMMFVYPSLYEGFGLPVLEAMKCGCPVITSNTSSLPEVIGQAGIQINPTNDEELINAYKKMYEDTFFRELCKERGLIRAKAFSWQKAASELLEFMETKCV